MTAILCDLCRRELAPRTTYSWVSAGGVVVLVGRDDGTAYPARLQCAGRDVNEVCTACVEKCMARTWVKI